MTLHNTHLLPHPRLVCRLSVAAVLVTGMIGSSAPAQAPPSSETPKEIFGVLRTGQSVSLPEAPARTLAALRTREPGHRLKLDLSSTRRIGPRRAALYLIPAADGVCAVHGSRGACSDDLAGLSQHGLRFWVHHRRAHPGDARRTDLYGVLPDGLTTISVGPTWDTDRQLVGTNAHNNGYVLRLYGPITSMMLTGPRGGTSLGPLLHPG